VTQPISVIHILVAGEPAEYRLTQQAAQGVTTVLAGACIGERFSARVSQAHRVVQLAIRQQPSIGSDYATPELTLRRRSKSNLSAPRSASPAGCAMTAPFDQDNTLIFDGNLLNFSQNRRFIRKYGLLCP
jgi:hypothetical protein